MKVILKRDVPKLGRAYDVLEVNEGYANNFLFPNKLAIKATKELIDSSKQKKAEKEGQKLMHHNLLEKTITELDGKEFTIKKVTNEKGTLFSKIHEKDICEIINKDLGIKLEEKMIILNGPIESIGDYKVSILSEEVGSTVNIKIESTK